MDRIAAAADLIAAARRDGTRLDLLPEAFRPRDEAEAYRVQKALHARLRGRRIGYKIGCTTPVMQKFLRIPNPCAGAMFDTGMSHLSATLPFAAFRHVGIECEIAVRLGSDVASGPFTAERMAKAVTTCMAAIEIVDDRFVDYRKMDTPTLIADDFFNWGCVLGPEVLADAGAMTEAVGTTAINGVEVGRGRGSDVLGHPLNALAWLAESLAARGEHLRAGEIVSTGSLVETKWLAQGDHALVAVSGLGSVTLDLT
jgi:2-keto-4-pentenoate hydratase